MKREGGGVWTIFRGQRQPILQSSSRDLLHQQHAAAMILSVDKHTSRAVELVCPLFAALWQVRIHIVSHDGHIGSIL